MSRTSNKSLWPFLVRSRHNLNLTAIHPSVRTSYMVDLLTHLIGGNHLFCLEDGASAARARSLPGHRLCRLGRRHELGPVRNVSRLVKFVWYCLPCTNGFYWRMYWFGTDRGAVKFREFREHPQSMSAWRIEGVEDWRTDTKYWYMYESMKSGLKF